MTHPKTPGAVQSSRMAIAVLMVRGDANDFAQVSNLSTDWAPTHTVVACDGHQYSVYNAKTGDAQLLIDMHIVNASHVL
jgi:hypothetical protein